MRTSNARDTARLWIDADTGAFSTDGAAWFEPGLPLVAFLDRPVTWASGGLETRPQT